MTEEDGPRGNRVIRESGPVPNKSKNSIKWPTLSHCFIEQPSTILVPLKTQRRNTCAAAAGKTTTLCRNRQQPPSNAISNTRVPGLPCASLNAVPGIRLRDPGERRIRSHDRDRHCRRPFSFARFSGRQLTGDHYAGEPRADRRRVAVRHPVPAGPDRKPKGSPKRAHANLALNPNRKAKPEAGR